MSLNNADLGGVRAYSGVFAGSPAVHDLLAYANDCLNLARSELVAIGDEASRSVRDRQSGALNH